MAYWKELNQDLLVEIARRIRCFKDYTAFRGVCSTWRFAAAKEKFLFFHDPLLMLAPKDDSDVRDFFHLSTGMVHQISLAEANGKRYFSSQGCLVTIGQTLDVKIVHPFSNLQVKLPSMKTIEYWDEFFDSSMYERFIRKCALSSNPLLESDYIVMIIFGGRDDLFYAKPGDERWTFLCPGICCDITLYKGQLYAARFGGTITACNIGGDNPNELEKVAQLPSTLIRPTPTPPKYYIVECAGQLLLISRYVEKDAVESLEEYEKADYRTIGFQVFKIDLTTKIFTEIKDLGNNIIFLGYNSTFSLEAHLTTCKPNSIYFTDDFLEGYFFNDEGGGKDMGVYNLQDESITPHYSDKSLDHITPPMWVEKKYI